MPGRLAPIRHRVVRPGTIPAGASFTLPKKGAEVWQLLSLVFTLQTNAVVANRFAEVRVSDGTDVYLRAGVNAAQAASLTQTYSAFGGAGHAAALSSVVFIPLPVPGVFVPAGHRVQLVVVNGDAGDQLSAVAAAVVDYRTGPLAPGLPIPEPYVEQFDPTYLS